MSNFIKVIDGIEICDNAFNEEKIINFSKKIFSDENIHFGYIAKSNYEEQPSFWFMPLIMENGKINLFFEEELNYFKNYFSNKIIRAYMNAQTFGQSGSFHQDDGSITYLFYPDPNWNIERGGGTEFRLQDDISFVVYPKFNRLIKFNSKIYHRSLPNPDPKGLRVSVAFKTE